MKLIGLLLFAAFTAAGQEQPMSLSQSLKNEIARQVREHKIEARRPPPNEVRAGRVAYSGIAVLLARTSQPLHLVNPAAPAQYGTAQQNVVLSPITGRATGLKIFSLNF